MRTRRPLRVVTLIDTPVAAGGAERIAMQIALRLDRDRYESVVCASRFDPLSATPAERVAEDALRSGGVRLLSLRRSGARDLAAWRPLVQLLRSERVDVLHAHMFGSNFWATVIGNLVGVPVIVAHEHGWGVAMTGRVRRLIDRWVIARGSDAFIAVSGETRLRMIESGGIRPRDIVFIPNGIPPLPATPGADVRAELGIPAGAPVIGTVAVLRPEKDLGTLIRSAALLRQRFPDLRVLIAGLGDEQAKLERRIDELGLRETVTLLGFRSDVADLLAALDVAVFSSRSEGSPLAVMEAMDAERPIVSTRVGGVPDLIDDGVHGLLVPPRDPEALAAAVARALEDREAAAAMGRRAGERRRRDFDIAGMVSQIERLYDSLYARSRRGRREGFVPRREQPAVCQ